MGVLVFRRVQKGNHGEPAITRERKHFSEIHESDCKPSTCFACSYLNWREEVSAALCSAVDRTNDKTTTVTLRSRVNYKHNWGSGLHTTKHTEIQFVERHSTEHYKKIRTSGCNFRILIKIKTVYSLQLMY